MRVAARICILLLVLCVAERCDAKPPRVISLYPGHTDNVAALGAGGTIVAVSANDDLESLQGLPRLAARVTPEAVLAHRPDVVLMRSLNDRAEPNLLPTLERAGVRVYVIEPPTWEIFDEYLIGLARILGLDSLAGTERLERLRRDAGAALRARSADREPPRVFLEATEREIRTCSPDSWAARVIEMCGGVNAASDAAPLRAGSPLAAWGVERAVALAGRGLDIYLVQQGAMNTSTAAGVRARPWFYAMAGVRLEFVPERELSRPSLIGLERAVRVLIPLFYPEAEPGDN